MAAVKRNTGLLFGIRFPFALFWGMMSIQPDAMRICREQPDVFLA